MAQQTGRDSKKTQLVPVQVATFDRGTDTVADCLVNSMTMLGKERGQWPLPRRAGAGARRGGRTLWRACS